jgi:hypothetical protein
MYPTARAPKTRTSKSPIYIGALPPAPVTNKLRYYSKKVSANRVIGELECDCELIHGLFARPQLLKNPPPRAFQQSLSPTSVLHSETVRSAANQVKVVAESAGRQPAPRTNHAVSVRAHTRWIGRSAIRQCGSHRCQMIAASPPSLASRSEPDWHDCSIHPFRFALCLGSPLQQGQSGSDFNDSTL